MKFWQKQNRLDEMQEQALLRIESQGFWLMWAGLLLAMAVQLVLGQVEKLAGEWIIFMAGDIYLMARCLRSGIWDRHFVPSAKVNALMSLAAGSAVFLLTGFAFGFWLGAAFAGVLTALMTFAALSLGMALYRKRRRALDAPSQEETE